MGRDESDEARYEPPDWRRGVEASIRRGKALLLADLERERREDVQEDHPKQEE